MASKPYITFRLGSEHFALPVSEVREVLDWELPSRLPQAPPHMLGIIDVRGCAIPIIDFGIKFGLGPVQPGPKTRILIMEFQQANRIWLVGGVADSIDEVLCLEPEEISESPSLGSNWRSALIHGVSRTKEHFTLLLHTLGIFDSNELLSLTRISKPGNTDHD